MKLPGGCGENSKKTTKLESAIHGLKQSGRKSGHLCADTLIADGFEQCKANLCNFRKIVDGVVVMIIGVFVDNVLGGGSRKDCVVTTVSEQDVSNKRPWRVHLVRWVWHREDRKVRYDKVVARIVR